MVYFVGLDVLVQDVPAQYCLNLRASRFALLAPCFAKNCGEERDKCKCEARSRSAERGRTTAESRVGSMDLKALTAALKPMMKEAIREEVTERIADLELRVDRADESIAGLKVLEPRVDQLETDVRELKKRENAMEAKSTGQQSQGQSSGGFTPTFIEIKGFCTFDERREKGLSRTEVKRHFDELKAILPEDLKEHFKEVVPTGLFSYKVKVKVTPGHAFDMKASLNDIFQQGQHLINGAKPYVVTERTPEAQQKFATFGKEVEAVKAANNGKSGGQEVIIEPRYLAIFLKVKNEERPKFIAEVRRNGILDWNNENCQSLLGKSAKEVEAMVGQRR